MIDRSTYLELLRELARGDSEGYRRRCDELDAQGWGELALVLGAAFYLAVRKRLAMSSDQASIIRYVAHARVEMLGTGFDLDPKVAESLIRIATTDDISEVEDLDSDLAIEAEMLLLWSLLRSLPESELSRFLAEVDTLSQQWTTEQTPLPPH
ncbi:hypothetical protein I0C86_39870, partial [Plantactinospora sp. S1510]